MKVVQMVPTLAYGDAIGNDVFAIDKALKEMGYDADIYAECMDGRLPVNSAKKIKDIPYLNKNDIAILHLSIGSDCNYLFGFLKCKRIVRYHNVTPPNFFENNQKYLEKICRWALESVEFLADKTDYCIADSEFNKLDLIEIGYQCKIDVLPIVIRFSDYEKKPNTNIVKKYQGKDIILFAGRIAPNKKQEDVIRVFSIYKKFYNPNAKLILVGSYDPKNIYYRELIEYIKILKVEDVVFTGHIKFEDILAYFHVAKVFLCQSEHEGFCVPLVEAMYFKIPIIAYASTAIPYTLGKGGILVGEKNFKITAGIVDRVMRDEDLRIEILKQQTLRLKDFSYFKIKEQLKISIDNIIAEGDKNEKNSFY